VNWTSGNVHAVATTGLRRSFHRLNPSIGASFQAPPQAVSQPPSPPTSTSCQTATTPVGWSEMANQLTITDANTTVSPRA
jgi:hypothetical protein